MLLFSSNLMTVKVGLATDSNDTLFVRFCHINGYIIGFYPDFSDLHSFVFGLFKHILYRRILL